MKDVVSLRKEGGIAWVAMEERTHKNTFSKPLIQGLLHAFDDINGDETVRVVVVHGYDSYFCCGGTKEELVGIFEGRYRFNDMNFHDLFQRCKVPVIAAMNGHALGGGLVLGCYADYLILAEEAMYAANFMKYGFTPGMGATLIIPEKFGKVLGWEMLYSANNYQGVDLKARGVGATVVPKAEVLAVAGKLAAQLAERPTVALRVLKEHLTRTLREQLPETVAREVKMHEITFAQPEVLARIESLFNG